MSASKFTVYILKQQDAQFSEVCKNIVEKYNQNEAERNNNVEYKEQDIIENTGLKHIEEIKIYVAPHRTIPKWKDTLMNLIENTGVDDIKNINYSFLFFIKINDSIFAITGGKGHLVINEHKNYFFGLDILSKIMEPNDNIIKSTGDRALHGNRFSGIQQFNNFVNLRSEDSISSYFRQINTHLDKKIIFKEFGIDINNGRDGVNFLARDSIKLGKSLTLNELDLFVLNIDRLVNKEDTKSLINKFTEINNQDIIYSELNERLESDLMNLIKNKKIDSNISLLRSTQFDLECDYYILKNRSHKRSLHESESQLSLDDIIDVLKGKYSKPEDLQNINLIEDFLKPVRLYGILDCETEVDDRIFDLLDVHLRHNESSYIFISGKWFLLDNQFIEEIDGQFKSQVTPYYVESDEFNFLNSWVGGSEGEYNFSHYKNDDVQVLDKILVDNIEVCDLMTIKDNKTFYVHVKDGLAGDTRILCAQILIAMQAIQNVKTHADTFFLEKYYESIFNKLSTDSEQLKKSAEKFINEFPTKDEFVSWIIKSSPTFIFAFRPNNHDIYEPKTISSTPAKIAMLNMVREAKLYDIDLKIVAIENS
ncbi:DUF6119 family protein [Halobacillus karajensis]|uniref:DUF6119 family protein n=2 Tax=Halobacillus karajensis TaxID=195088 RepID=UPI00045C35DB|nr:DUF6119 family protein [Halobacillus karajensis]CDQ27111.1 sporadically distributed protein [Halobacillus karajensis]